MTRQTTGRTQCGGGRRWRVRGGAWLRWLGRGVVGMAVAIPVVQYWLLVAAVVGDPQLAATPLGLSTWGQVLGPQVLRLPVWLLGVGVVVGWLVTGRGVLGGRPRAPEEHS